MRQGKVWDPVLSAREKSERLQRQRLENEEKVGKKKANEFVPKSNYQEKYSHLIGTDADLVIGNKLLFKKIESFCSSLKSHALFKFLLK